MLPLAANIHTIKGTRGILSFASISKQETGGAGLDICGVSIRASMLLSSCCPAQLQLFIVSVLANIFFSSTLWVLYVTQAFRCLVCNPRLVSWTVLDPGAAQHPAAVQVLFTQVERLKREEQTVNDSTELSGFPFSVCSLKPRC